MERENELDAQIETTLLPAEWPEELRQTFIILLGFSSQIVYTFTSAVKETSKGIFSTKLRRLLLMAWFFSIAGFGLAVVLSQLYCKREQFSKKYFDKAVAVIRGFLQLSIGLAFVFESIVMMQYIESGGWLVWSTMFVLLLGVVFCAALGSPQP